MAAALQLQQQPDLAVAHLKQFPAPPKKAGGPLLSMALLSTRIYSGRRLAGRLVVNTCSTKGISDRKFDKHIGAVVVQLYGREHVHWTETHGSGQNSNTVHFRGQADVCGVSAIQGTLVGANSSEGPGAIGALSELTINTERGLHVHNFELPVPDNFPTAMRHGGPVQAEIRYEVAAFVQGADGKVIHRITVPVTIVQSQQPPPSEKMVYLEQAEVSKGAPPFDFKASLQNPNVGIGEAAVVEFSVNNHTNWELERIEMRLVAHWTAIANGAHKKTRKWDVTEAVVAVINTGGDSSTMQSAAGQVVKGKGKGKGNKGETLVPLVFPNCGNDFVIPSAVLTLPSTVTPSVAGSIVKVTHTLSVLAYLRDHGAKGGLFKAAVTKTMKNISMPINVCAPTEPLPQNWQQFFDPSNGRFYFQNDATRESTFNDPRSEISWANIARVLRVRVNAGRELVSCDRNGKSDPYVQVWLLVAGEKVPLKARSGRSSIQKKTLEPVWDDGRFGFFLAPTQVPEALVIECRDWNMVGNDDFMGCTQIPLAAVAAALPPAYTAMGSISSVDVSRPPPPFVFDEWVALAARPNKPKEKVSGQLHVQIGWLS